MTFRGLGLRPWEQKEIELDLVGTGASASASPSHLTISPAISTAVTGSLQRSMGIRGDPWRSMGEALLQRPLIDRAAELLSSSVHGRLLSAPLKLGATKLIARYTNPSSAHLAT